MAPVVDDATSPRKRDPVALIERPKTLGDDAAEVHEQHLAIVARDAPLAPLAFEPAHGPAPLGVLELRPADIQILHRH